MFTKLDYCLVLGSHVRLEMFNHEMIRIENSTQHHFIKWFSLDGIIERYKKEEIVEGHTLGEPVTRVSGRKPIFN